MVVILRLNRYPVLSILDDEFDVDCGEVADSASVHWIIHCSWTTLRPKSFAFWASTPRVAQECKRTGLAVWLRSCQVQLQCREEFAGWT